MYYVMRVFVGHIPQQWVTNIIVVLRDINHVNNFIGITLSIAAKIFDKVLLIRMRNPAALC